MEARGDEPRKSPADGAGRFVWVIYLWAARNYTENLALLNAVVVSLGRLEVSNDATNTAVWVISRPAYLGIGTPLDSYRMLADIDGEPLGDAGRTLARPLLATDQP